MGLPQEKKKKQPIPAPYKGLDTLITRAGTLAIRRRLNAANVVNPSPRTFRSARVKVPVPPQVASLSAAKVGQRISSHPKQPRTGSVVVTPRAPYSPVSCQGTGPPRWTLRSTITVGGGTSPKGELTALPRMDSHALYFSETRRYFTRKSQYWYMAIGCRER